MSHPARANTAALYDVDEFLTFLDGRQDERWELIDGHPVMMAGGSLDHNTIALNLALLLRPPAQKAGCRVQSADVLVRNAEKGGFLAFPDVLVHCGPHAGTDRILTEPTIIIEVLSRSTLIFDRGIKFERYREMKSIEQICFVYQDQIRVESWTRTDQVLDEKTDVWQMKTLTELSMAAHIVRLDVDLALADIYADAFPQTAP